MELAHTKSVEQVYEHFGVDESKGLSLDEVRLSQEKYGPNGMYISLKNTSLIQRQNFVICDEKLLPE